MKYDFVEFQRSREVHKQSPTIKKTRTASLLGDSILAPIEMDADSRADVLASCCIYYMWRQIVCMGLTIEQHYGK